jgi:hypothetical protein
MKSKTNSCGFVTVDNLVGLVLAILIVFQIRPKPEDTNLLNTPVAIVISLVLVAILFVTLHPIVGLLALIYLYEILRHSPSYVKSTNYENMEKLNTPKEIQLEEVLIRESDYSRIKNQNMDRDTDVKPLLPKINSTMV